MIRMNHFQNERTVLLLPVKKYKIFRKFSEVNFIFDFLFSASYIFQIEFKNEILLKILIYSNYDSVFHLYSL